jgi:hypothetical protein
MKTILALFFSILVLSSPLFALETQHVVIVVIDGARYTETFGDATHLYVPRMWNDLRPAGTLYTAFYNNGRTETSPGHSTILTGAYEDVNNAGGERPHSPTVFEYLRKEDGALANENFVVLGKTKLETLTYSDFTGYGASYGASKTQAPSQYNDNQAADSVKHVLQTFHPRLLIVNLAAVDNMGHANNWSGYLSAIRNADSLTYVIWNTIQADPVMGGKTTMIVTNDHGRHTSSFVNHGDGCEGCRHIMLLVVGPDTPAGAVDATTWEQIDIAPTVGAMAGFSTPYSVGTVITSAMSESPNAAPVASEVSVTGGTTVGQTLTLHYTYSDADDDAEGVSTFRWLRNGAAIADATSTTYTLVPADAGTMVACEVTPVASTGTLTGGPVQSPAVGPVAPLGAQKLYVSTSGSDVTGDGTLANPFATIQKGVTSAVSGDTVMVLPGTYVGVVNVTKSLTLMGSGASTTTIEAPIDFATNGTYNHALTNFGTERAIVYVGSSSAITVTVHGFTIDGKSRGPAITQLAAYSGLLAERCNITVRANTVRNILPADPGSVWDPDRTYNGRGIHVRGSGAVAVIDSNTLEEINRLYIMINATDQTWQLPAVFPQATVSNNILTGKGQYLGGQRGIWYNAGAWGTIAGNTITEMDYPNPVIEPERASGIVVRNGHLNTAHRRMIRDNTLMSSTCVNNKAMYLQGIQDSVIGNTITGFRWGMEVHQDLVAVLGNTITGGVIGVLVTSENPAGTEELVTIGGSPENMNTIVGQNTAAGGFAISLSFRDPLDNVTFLSPIPVDARYNDFGVYTESAIKALIWDRADTTLIGGLKVDTVLFSLFYTPPPPHAVANVRALLQGPYAIAGDTMSTALRAVDLMPKNHPYNGTPWNYAGSDSVDAIPPDVVDWVLVELRTAVDSASTVGRRAAFITNDGTIVDLDGTSAVEFAEVDTGSYHIIVRHRNHLAVMSQDPVALSATSPLYDFTTGLDKYYHGDAALLNAGTYGLWGGDADASGDIAANDRTATWNGRNQTGYFLFDVDLSGDVAATDRSLNWNSRNKFTQVP